MTRFTYIYDTYCGWCYGASKVIEALIESGAELRMMHRQLFQGPNAHRMADGFGKVALQHDRKIATLTGMDFSQRYVDNVLMNANEVLDSRLTAQAAALVHNMGPHAEFTLLKTLQEARFIEGKPSTDDLVIYDALKAAGVESTLETAARAANEMSRNATEIQARMGLRGVPALLIHTDAAPQVINISDFYDTPKAIQAFAQ